MAIQVASGEEDEINSSINTTPLVDVMLVLLVIFLITIPVVIRSVPVKLPQASNIPTETKPQNVIIAVDSEGHVYWNDAIVASNDELLTRLRAVATVHPQPEVHIRADRDARFESVGKIIVDLQRSAIQKVGFITQPDKPSSYQ